MPQTMSVRAWMVLPCFAVAAWAADQGEAVNPAPPARIRDILWVWGNPEMARPGPHTLASFAHASPAERALLLGAPNIVLAGAGLPRNIEQAEAISQEASRAPRLVWEIACDDEGGGPPFEFGETVNRIVKVAANHTQLEGVLLDDMSTRMIDRGFKPEHIRRLREQLDQACPRITIWGVVYTMNLDLPDIAAYLRELDVITLWTWHGRDIPKLEQNVARCEQLFPGKPIVLGLYLHDYGEGRPMPQDLLERQCAVALELAQAGRIQGAVFLTIDDEPETLSWTAEWIRHVGDQPLALAETAAPAGLRIGDGAGWSFTRGAWTEDAGGLIRPPDQPNLHSRAFQTALIYKDFTAEFEFNGDYRETGTGSAGFAFGATDTNHFHCVWFPWGGQQLRAKHFWAALGRVDGDGYIRNIAMEWVPGVPSETDRWYKVRVEARDSSVRVWVDGRRALEVDHVDYSQGAVGLMGYGWYAFRNGRVSGTRRDPINWSAAPVPSHAFPLPLTSEAMPTACLAPNGDVLLAAGTLLIRSHDQGRTWTQPEPLPEKLGELSDYGSAMFRTRDNRLIVMIYHPQDAERRLPEILLAESHDNGGTWTDPAPAAVTPGWPEQPKNLTPYGPLTETEDGVLLRFLLGGVKEEGDTFTDVITWSATHAKAFVIRSADGGQSWSAPIEIDQPSWVGKPRGTIPGSLDLTEPTGIAIGNRVMTLVRPIYSPTMWQCWSNDGGQTWDAAARVTFPGYAQSTVRTASGAILCAHRYPHYAVNISYDNGLNWDAGTVIDYPVWAMGCALETAPDVALLTYMNAQRSMPLLAQLVHVTANGLAPLMNND